jgi:PAS domain S-box-containing protein
VATVLIEVNRAGRSDFGIVAELMASYTEAALDPLGVLESAMDAIIAIDESETVVLFNAAAERTFGCPAASAVGGPLERFIPERFRAAHHGHIRRFGETGTTTRMMGSRLELFGLRADGAEFPMDASISQVTVEGRKLYTVILRDVSRRKAAEEALQRSYDELREMSGVMNEVREAERTRIARELHDELAQSLTAVKMDVAWLAARLPKEEKALVQRADRMKHLVDTTVMAVRRIAADLRPVMLDDLGLVPSIEHLVHSFSERAGIVARLDAPAEDIPPGDPLATGVYRIVQEALTNVARHANATEVGVSLRMDGDRLRVEVRDNGRGLGENRGEGKSYGLLGMRERAQTLGGSARIYSPPGGGTIVEVTVPVARYREQGSAR